MPIRLNPKLILLVIVTSKLLEAKGDCADLYNVCKKKGAAAAAGMPAKYNVDCCSNNKCYTVTSPAGGSTLPGGTLANYGCCVLPDAGLRDPTSIEECTKTLLGLKLNI